MKANEQRCRISINPNIVDRVKAKLEANNLNIKFFTAYMNTTCTWSGRFLSGSTKRTTKQFYERLMVFLETEDVKELPLLVPTKAAKPKKQSIQNPDVAIMPPNFKPHCQMIMPRIWAEQSGLVSKYLNRK